MNRVNFGQSSGVVIDVCKPHGIWFDPDELRRIVLFITSGGLERQQERDKQELEDERRRLELDRAAPLPPPDLNAPHPITTARLLGDLFF
jgi:Zn-finger nucleic acid-binding protein